MMGPTIYSAAVLKYLVQCRALKSGFTDLLAILPTQYGANWYIPLPFLACQNPGSVLFWCIAFVLVAPYRGGERWKDIMKHSTSSLFGSLLPCFNTSRE